MRIERNAFATIFVAETQGDVTLLETFWQFTREEDKSYDKTKRTPLFRESADDINILIDHGM